MNGMNQPITLIHFLPGLKSSSVAFIIPGVFSTFNPMLPIVYRIFLLKFFFIAYIFVNFLKVFILTQLQPYREVAKIMQIILIYLLPRFYKSSHLITFALVFFLSVFVVVVLTLLRVI